MDSVILPIVDVEYRAQRIRCAGRDSANRVFDVYVDDIPNDTRELMWEHWTRSFTLPEIRIVGDCTTVHNGAHTLRNPRFDAHIWR